MSACVRAHERMGPIYAYWHACVLTFRRVVTLGAGICAWVKKCVSVAVVMVARQCGDAVAWLSIGVLVCTMVASGKGLQWMCVMTAPVGVVCESLHVCSCSSTYSAHLHM